MKITFLLTGKTVKNWIKEGLDIYVDRLSHYVNFEVKEIPELKNVSALSREQIRQREGELILKNVRESDRVVLLDERGWQGSSLEFAELVRQDMQRGRNIVFVVGGAYGFSADVYARAESKISLSRMTYSHQMVRVIFAEQLYRAFTIINGEPYHHE